MDFRICFFGVALICVGYGLVPECYDFLMTDVCEHYVTWGKCHLFRARSLCRKSCLICGTGWSAWSGWSTCSANCKGEQSRTRYCKSEPDDCPGNDTHIQECSVNEFACIAIETTPAGLTTKSLFDLRCNETHFLCDKLLYICIPLQLVCDGYNDCPSGRDEQPTSCIAGIYDDTFQIKNELKQVCIEVITDDPAGPINAVRGYRRCPSHLNPQRNRYLWRWWKSFHLINIETGRCLEAENPLTSNPSKLKTEVCDDAQLNQKWVCDDYDTGYLLVRLRKLTKDGTKRYIGMLDEHGWPLVLSANRSILTSIWHRSPDEPPSTICQDQVYWTEWTSWTDCSATCVGGRRGHTRVCVNGRVGVSPCVGSPSELEPCNGNRRCTSYGQIVQNSDCSDGWVTLKNARRLASPEHLDPGCFQLFTTPPRDYNDSKKVCKFHRSFLASDKEELSNEFLVDLMQNRSITSLTYIGIEEDYTKPPVQGHVLRYVFDGTPIGHHKPWKVDCVLGPGFDYRGTVSETASGLECQKWNEDSPHEVEYEPVGSTNHNHCRNPNFDLRGPWCYTRSEKVEKEYCEIPQCMSLVPTAKLSPLMEFRIVNPCFGGDGIIGSENSWVITANIKDSDPLGGVLSQEIRTTGCSKMEKSEWSKVGKESKFVWDSTRSRIINIQYMLCLEAASAEPDALVTLQKCDANKPTQRWKADGKVLQLTHSKFKSDLHLDVSLDRESMVVTSAEIGFWFVTRSRGHVVDWASLRKIPQDDSFELYSINDDLCVTVRSNVSPNRRTADSAFAMATVAMDSCRFSQASRWIKMMSTRSNFMNLQTSLCLTAEHKVPGTGLAMQPCRGGEPKQSFHCHDDLRLSLGDFFLVVNDGNLTLSINGETATRWRIWGSKNRTVCSVQIPRGNVASGAIFAIRNIHNKMCLQTDEAGAVFTQECKWIGNFTHEVWRFTESPTMIMHYPTLRCLTAAQGRSGSVITSKSCNVWDSNQHWTMFPQTSSLFYEGKQSIFYSVHLLSDMILSLKIKPDDNSVVLRHANTNQWVAYNKFFIPSSLESMQDCVVTSGGINYYRGNASVGRSGSKCEFWPESERIVYRELEENYCRNPGIHSDFPWCFVRNERGELVKDECLIDYCPSTKVAIDEDGKWNPVAGDEAFSFFCQAEPECYRGIGMEYIGSWNITLEGICISWKDHIDDGVPVHNYCRNPTGSMTGPWCYIDEAASIRKSCPVPKCHRTCHVIPESLHHSETAMHEYSATVHGFEYRSSVMTQCLVGHWVAKGVTRHSTECINGIWTPEPAACKVIVCSAIGFQVESAELISPSFLLYNQAAVYKCDGDMMAGPIKYRCNELGEWEKDPNQESKCTPACQDGWEPFRQYCHKINETKLNFEEALLACQQHNGTLADLEDKVDFDFLKHMIVESGATYGSQTVYWVGVKHYPKTPIPKDPTWRDYRSINQKTKMERDENRGANYLPFLRTSFYIMHYMHNRFTKEFDPILAYYLRCMFVDAKHKFVASRGCYDYPKEKMLWRWVTPYHLFNEAQQLCLTGKTVDGSTPEDIEKSAMATKCDTTASNQFVGCQRHGHSSLKLLHNDFSYFVDDVTEPWDKVQMGGGHYGGNYSIWVLNETLYDICHHSMLMTGNVFLLWEGLESKGESYTYSEAQEKCKERGAKLATEDQLNAKMASDDISSCACSWGDGNVAYSVMRTNDPLCPRSAPSGGVKRCQPNPSKADAWCFKGTDRDAINIPWAAAIWLDNATREGVQERSSEDATKFICRKESRWHCPRPSDVYRATLKETIHTSYSYRGVSSYQCDDGYWFERGLYAKMITCTAELLWEPHPETLECVLLECLPPADIAHANKSYDKLDYKEMVEYTCHHGYWFNHGLYRAQLYCGNHAYWDPAPHTLQCSPVQCDRPTQVDHAFTDIHSYVYSNNATVTCDDGYWVKPGQITMEMTCNADGVWEPDPFFFRCWEVICQPPPDQKYAVWTHVDEKHTIMSCEEGFQFKPKNPGAYVNITHQVELECNGQGQWVPDVNDYLCEEVVCSPPPFVGGTDNNGDITKSTFDHGADVIYSCEMGFYLTYVFAPFSVSYDSCLILGEDKLIYVSKDLCGSSQAIYLQWGSVSEVELSPDYGGLAGKGAHLVEYKSSLCLAVVEIPISVASVRPLTLAKCNETDIRQHWFCNQHSVSDLIIGMRGTLDYYITTNRDTWLVHTTKNRLDGLEFVSYEDRDDPVELNICRYQSRHFQQKTSCLRFGGWTPDPKKIKCDVIMCPDPPDHDYARMSMTSSEYLYAAAVTYKCKDGYEYLWNRTTFVSRCSEDSTWVPDPGEYPCKKVKCPKYILPPGALVTKGNIEKHRFRDKMIISCRVGWVFYGKVNAYNVKCGSDKKWIESHHVNACRVLECPEPPSLNYSMIILGNRSRGYQSLVRYQCTQGYWFERGVTWKDVHCSKTATWTPDPLFPQCQLIDCGDPGPIPNTIRYDVPPEETTYGGVVMYKCAPGLWFRPGLLKVALTCRDDGLWHPHPTSLYCEVITCNRPSTRRNAFLIGADYGHGSVVTVMCDPGYRVGGHDPDLTNHTIITCTKEKVWIPDPNLIDCHPVSCGAPPSVGKANRIESSDFYGSYAQYFCNVGYWIHPGVHVGLLQCSASGKWQPDTLTCRDVDCGHPGNFPNAHPVYPTGVTWGSITHVRCQTGFWINGAFDVALRCSERGLWEPPPEEIECKVVWCMEPGQVKNANRTILNDQHHAAIHPITKQAVYEFGTRVLYTCGHALEFARKQSSIITSCSGSGRWTINIDNLHCHDVVCDDPTPVLHGRVTHAEPSIVNSTVSYQCIDGYWLNRTSTEITGRCLPSGEWSIHNVACIRVMCDEPYAIDQGFFINRGLTFTYTTRYYCDEGYRIQGSRVATCNMSGLWEPNDIKCEVVDCGPQPNLTNAEPQSNHSTVYNTTIIYNCTDDHYFDINVDTMEVRCLADGRWSNSDQRCLHVSELKCEFPDDDPYIHFTHTTPGRALIHCDPGFAILSSRNSTTYEVTCGGDGEWHPVNFTQIKCEEVYCPRPMVNHSIMTSQAEYQYASEVDVQCRKGYSVKQSMMSSLVMSFICNETGGWWPDPTSYACTVIDCGIPLTTEGVVMSYDTTLHTSKATFSCRDNFTSFGQSDVKESLCSDDGTWSPNPVDFECRHHKCSVPKPQSQSVHSIEVLDQTGNTWDSETQILRITCDLGSLMPDSNRSLRIPCNKFGQWNGDITNITCQGVICGPPIVPIKSIHPEIAPSYKYGESFAFACPPNMWFRDGVMLLTAKCGEDSNWTPDTNLTCVDAYCKELPLLPHSRISRGGTEVGSQSSYKCNPGFWMQRGVTNRTTRCQGNGRWLPSPQEGDLQCKEITCDRPADIENSRIVNSSLSFVENTSVEYECLQGYWFQRGVMSRQLLCVGGDWDPDPYTTIKCVVVHCDVIAQVDGARVDGHNTVAGTNITYTCARGLHFPAIKSRRLMSNCSNDGLWLPDPLLFSCYDVACDELTLEGASKSSDERGIDSTVEFTCPRTTWFKRDTPSIAATCSEDGRWIPDVHGMRCVVVDCGKPPIEYIRPSDVYTYTTEILIQCLGGFNLDPPVPEPMVCDESGSWFPDPNQYKCLRVTCKVPRYIRHASMVGEPTFNNTLIVTCDPGFHVRIGVNQIRSTCLADKTWTINLNTILCISFVCREPVSFIEHSTRTSINNPPMYNSMYKYSCDNGYWVRRRVYSQAVRCNELGTWDPPINFTCSEIRCFHPPYKLKSKYFIKGGENKTDFPIDQTMRFVCNEYSWLTVQHHVTDWSFNGANNVTMICENTGQWNPHPDSFACREITEGAVPVGYPRGLTESEVLYENWLQDPPLQMANHTYLTAVQTGVFTWNGGSTMKSSVVRSQTSSEHGHSVENIWDGDPITSWRPTATNNLGYNMTIYLGGLFIVKGVEVDSGTHEGDKVAGFRLGFSDDGKSFNRSIKLAMRDGRLANEPIRTEESGVFRFTGFHDVAKFIQITILGTNDLVSKPTIREIQFLTAPAQWAIVYPIDEITMPTILVCVVMCMILMTYSAVKRDKLDRKSVFLVVENNVVAMETKSISGDNIPMVSGQTTSNTISADIVTTDTITTDKCIMIQLKLGKKITPMDVVCRFDGQPGKPVMITHRVATDTIWILQPTNQELSLFQLGLIFGDSPSQDSIDVTIKIAELGIDDILTGRMTWLFVRESVTFIQGIPQSFSLNKGGKRRVTMARIESLGGIRKLFLEILSRHLVYSTVISDFLSQVSRSERTILGFLGLFISLSCSSLLLSMTSQWILSSLVSMASIPCIILGFYSFIQSPTFDPLAEPQTQPPLDGTRLSMVLSKLEYLDVASSGKSPSFSGSEDSWLLPWKLRYKHLSLIPDDILSRDLEDAFNLRVGRLRRTRSAPAIMMTCDESESSVSEDDVLSCASMWSRSSIVDQWHRVHRSVVEPIDDLFEKCEPSDSRSLFSWFDPEYHRIPSRMIDHPLTEPPDWLREEMQKRRRVCDMSSATTQYPTSYKLGRHFRTISTQKPSLVEGDAVNIRRTSRNRYYGDVMTPSAGAALCRSDSDITISTILQQSKSQGDGLTMTSQKSTFDEASVVVNNFTDDVSVALAADSFYKDPRKRKTTKFIIYVTIALCIVIIGIFGIRRIDDTSKVLIFVGVTIISYLTIALCIDALLRHNVLKNSDRLTFRGFLAQAASTVNESSSNF